MAGITIETPDGDTRFASGDHVRLRAQAPAGTAAYRWLRGGEVVGQGSSTLDLQMEPNAVGEYTVEATGHDGATLSGAITLGLKTDAPAPSGMPAFPRIFGLISAIGLLALGVTAGALIWVGRFHGGLSDGEWSALDGRLKVAMALALPALVLGSVVLLVGFWMAMVEWRGRMVADLRPARGGRRGAPKESLGGGNGAKVVEAIGGLGGAAMAMIVGAILMLGAIWIGASAAGGPSNGASGGAPVSTPFRSATPSSAPGGSFGAGVTSPPTLSPRPGPS